MFLLVSVAPLVFFAAGHVVPRSLHVTLLLLLWRLCREWAQEFAHMHITRETDIATLSTSVFVVVVLLLLSGVLTTLWIYLERYRIQNPVHKNSLWMT